MFSVQFSEVSEKHAPWKSISIFIAVEYLQKPTRTRLNRWVNSTIHCGASRSVFNSRMCPENGRLSASVESIDRQRGVDTDAGLVHLTYDAQGRLSQGLAADATFLFTEDTGGEDLIGKVQVLP